MISQPHTINFVGTRCTNGDHPALQRWYADHVHLLLTAPELRQAELFRCQQTLSGQAPEYFCIYGFDSHDDFLKFEHGHEKAKATELTNAAAGRSSIEIVQRSQYGRCLHRQWPAKSQQQEHAWRLVACIQSPLEWSLDSQRWLADHLQALRACTDLKAAQVFVQYTQANEALLVLDFSVGEAPEIWQLLLDLFEQPAVYGHAQTLQVSWASSAKIVQSWLR